MENKRKTKTQQQQHKQEQKAIFELVCVWLLLLFFFLFVVPTLAKETKKETSQFAKYFALLCFSIFFLFVQLLLCVKCVCACRFKSSLCFNRAKALLWINWMCASTNKTKQQNEQTEIPKKKRRRKKKRKREIMKRKGKLMINQWLDFE